MTEPEWVCEDPAGEWGVVRTDNVAGYRRSPCATCPWRKDAPLGAFPDSVFDSSRHTSVQPEHWDGQAQAQFGCHASAPSTGAPASLTCAGFLAVAGRDNLSVRMAVLQGTIAPDALEPGEDWPELYDSYDAMAAANRAANARKQR
ncbi:DUF6283 family protein [Glycomyces sp. A-F 0318]|uniref:DUF6283 family protein n=1 Tax=Glycomyces amatae TaxID=2881355 RepID=UPI001E32989B|nr:DUF6283 family protein [Glycomyces amatae]MCD0446400.1 DUF6283 family protein [Glycomyces amatae]